MHCDILTGTHSILSFCRFFVRADFELPISSTNAKLLYFLNLGLVDLDIALGAGIFVDVDKEHGMRRADNPNSVRYGRLSIDDIKNRVPVKKDLFVVCAAGKLNLTSCCSQAHCTARLTLHSAHQFTSCCRGNCRRLHRRVGFADTWF